MYVSVCVDVHERKRAGKREREIHRNGEAGGGLFMATGSVPLVLTLCQGVEMTCEKQLHRYNYYHRPLPPLS